MKKIFNLTKMPKLFFGFALIQIFSLMIFAQTSAADKTTGEKGETTATTAAAQQTLPVVTQVDGDQLGKILKPDGKPLLVNFWATWCGPCVEEFPELVKINADYKEKLDVKAISLDDWIELNKGVPKFLAKVKSEIPAYLLKTADEDTAIQNVDKSWQGGLPFTILYNADGTIAYTRQGIINPKILREEIDKVVAK